MSSRTFLRSLVVIPLKKSVSFYGLYERKKRGKTERGERDIWVNLQHTQPQIN